MTIEIVVRLRHLLNSPLLDRARLMGQPMLVSANVTAGWVEAWAAEIYQEVGRIAA